MERKTVSIYDIVVPTKMLVKKPKLYKIMGMEAYLKKYKHFYGSVIVDKNLKVLDGYVIYYTAKKNKITEIPVTVVSTKERIKHFLSKYFRRVGR